MNGIIIECIFSKMLIKNVTLRSRKNFEHDDFHKPGRYRDSPRTSLKYSQNQYDNRYINDRITRTLYNGTQCFSRITTNNDADNIIKMLKFENYQ